MFESSFIIILQQQNFHWYKKQHEKLIKFSSLRVNLLKGISSCWNENIFSQFLSAESFRKNVDCLMS